MAPIIHNQMFNMTLILMLRNLFPSNTQMHIIVSQPHNTHTIHYNLNQQVSFIYNPFIFIKLILSKNSYSNVIKSYSQIHREKVRYSDSFILFKGIKSHHIIHEVSSCKSSTYSSEYFLMFRENKGQSNSY